MCSYRYQYKCHTEHKNVHIYSCALRGVCYSFLYCVLFEVRIQFHRVNYNFWKGNKTIVSVLCAAATTLVRCMGCAHEKYDIRSTGMRAMLSSVFCESVLAIWAIRYLHANGRSSQCDSMRSICTQHQMFDVEFMCVHHLVVLARSRLHTQWMPHHYRCPVAAAKYQMSAAWMWCLCAAKRFSITRTPYTYTRWICCCCYTRHAYLMPFEWVESKKNNKFVDQDSRRMALVHHQQLHCEHFLNIHFHLYFHATLFVYFRPSRLQQRALSSLRSHLYEKCEKYHENTLH